MKSSDTDPVYLDYASATPVRQAVKEVMEPYWSDKFANPHSHHSLGSKAKEAITKARETIADTLSVQPSEIVFTSGATESNALAVEGFLRVHNETQTRLITTKTAHKSQKNAGEKVDAKTDFLVGGNDGRIQPDQVLLDKSKNNLISIPYVNSEIGTIQPTRKIGTKLKKSEKEASLHIDASQAGLYMSLQPEYNGADLMTVNGHKLYGPKGVGMLWVRSGTPMASLFPTDKDKIVGDYQVLRPGTPPVPLIVGFAESVTWAQKSYQRRAKQVSSVRDFTLKQLTNMFPEAVINGSIEHRISNNINISFPDIDHGFLSTKLDREGVVVSTASACQSGRSGSDVIKSLPGNKNSAIRITLGRNTDKSAVRQLLKALNEFL